MDNDRAHGAERGTIWPPQDTTGWEFVPGPHACWCGMPACRSGWEWRRTAAASEAAPGGPAKTPGMEQAAAEPATEPGARKTGSSGPLPAGQGAPGWQPGAAARDSGRGTRAQMEREA